nr:MAG TPA: hypothetical protein [Inoviridae sp.]
MKFDRAAIRITKQHFKNLPNKVCKVSLAYKYSIPYIYILVNTFLEILRGLKKREK